MKRAPLTPVEKERILELYAAGIKYEAILVEFDLVSATLTRLVKQAGLARRGRGQRKKTDRSFRAQV